MNKFVKFCKKPLCIIASILIVVFTALLVFISCQSHGSKYSYSLELFGIKVETCVEFKEDTLTYSSYINGQINPEQEPVAIPYKITDGVLYTYPTDLNSPHRAGTINAYSLVLEQYDAEYPTETISMSLTCGLNNALKIVSIVMIVLGGVLLTVSIIVIVSNKNKSAEQTSPNQNLQPETQLPAQPKCPYCGSNTENQDVCPNCNAKL